MKNSIKTFIAFLLFTMFFCSSAKSQLYIHLGYNAGFPTGLKNLNYVIDRYNQNRNYLTTNMKHINYLDGFTMSLGAAAEPMFFGFGYTYGVQRIFAEFKDKNGDMYKRDVKVSNVVFDMDFGIAAIDKSKGSIFFGGSMAIGSFTVKSRIDLKSEVDDQDWEKINLLESLVFTGGVFIKIVFSNPGIYIQPYYQFTPGDIFKNDMTIVNEALNNTMSINDPSPLNISNSSVGIKVGFSISG